MLVPVGIAYAEASGVPGINGLYATIVPLLAYALFGPSRILVLGSGLGARRRDPRRRPAAVRRRSRARLRAGGMMAIVSGVVCVAAGLARLGFITELLSKPIRYGYMNGIALTVMLSQIPKLLGFSVEADGPLRQVWAHRREGARRQHQRRGLRDRRRHARADPAAQALAARPGHADRGGGRHGRRRRVRSRARAGVSVLGPLPQGLPAPRLPLVPLDSLVPILMGGVAVALVSFADTSVLSRTYAARLRTPVDPNQEMVGLGVANLAAGFFQGFPISSSSSRTPVAEAAGARPS